MEITEMKKMFYETFGEGGELRVFTSPGRVNLIGEHIDYCGGCVLPAALTMKTTIIARKRDDDIIRLKATDLDILVETKISEMESLKGKLKWGDYQLGVALEMMAAGYNMGGCDLLYDDTVPHGGGLSSSAAIEVSTALMVAKLFNEEKTISHKELAVISQKAEHNFIGVKCGIMDQFASAMGKENHAIYLNCATLDYEHIPLELSGSKIVLTNTNVKHSLGSSAYNERRNECAEGIAVLKQALPHITELSQVTPSEFEANKALITNETTRKRIEHVVYECDRVSQSAAALKAGDVASFGKFMNGSHDSLRDLYEVTCPELDFVVEEGRKIEGVAGIRMTGAGFGGCCVAIIKDSSIDTFIETVGKAYLEKFGHEASFYVTEIGDGAKEVKS